MKRPELALQKAVTEFLDVALPKDAFWTAFPAGGGGKIRGAQLKASGLKAGVPDLLVLYGGRAVFIELKSPKGRISDPQWQTLGKLADAGAIVYVARSVEQVDGQLRNAGIPLRTVGDWQFRKNAA